MGLLVRGVVSRGKAAVTQTCQDANDAEMKNS